MSEKRGKMLAGVHGHITALYGLYNEIVLYCTFTCVVDFVPTDNFLVTVSSLAHW